MKRILILVAIGLFLYSTGSAFQGGGGESTRNPRHTPKPRPPSVPKPKVEPRKRSLTPTPANIRGLKLGKDKNVSRETSSFGPGDTIYVVADISNAPGKLKVKVRLIVNDVEGQQSGPIPGLETTVELHGSGTATFTFSPPTAGWPKGKYKMEVLILNEDGEQKDSGRRRNLSVSADNTIPAPPAPVTA